LSDELFRRRGTAWSGPLHTEELSRAASELGAVLAWDQARMLAEQRRFEAEWNDWYASPYARQERSPLTVAAGTQQDA
jgi:hypothetical protein